MSLEIGKVYATVDGDTRLFSRSMGFVRKEGESTARYVARQFNQVGDAFQSVGKKLTIGLTAPLSAFAFTATRAANVQLQAEAQLLQALGGREDVQQRLIAQAKELQGTTLFGDEETIRAQALLGAFVDEEEAIKRLIPLIQDMATLKGMDLAGASDLVAKTIGSSTNALSRYGIEVTGAVGSTERLESLVAGLSDRFEGQAAILAQLGTGPMVQLKNAFGDLQEVIGAIILKYLNPLANRLTEVMKTLQELNPEVLRMGVVVAGFAAALGPALFGLGTLLKLLPLVATGFAVMTGPVGLAVAAIAGGAILIYKNWDTLREFFTTGAGSKMFDSLKRTATTAFSVIVSTVEGAVNLIMAIWNTFGESIVGVLSRNFERITSIVSFALDHINSMLILWSNLFTGNFSAAWEEMKNIAAKAVNFILHTVSRMVTGMLTMIADLLAAVGVLEGIQRAAIKAADGIDGFADSLKFSVTETERAISAGFDLREMLGGLFKKTEEVTEANEKAADSTAGVTKEVYKLKAAYDELNDVIIDPKLEEIAIEFTDVADAVDLVRLATDGMSVSVDQVSAALQVARTAFNEAYGDERRAEIQILIDQLTALQEEMTGSAQKTVEISQGAQFAMQIANEFTNSFGQGMANVIVQGEKLVDTLRNIGKLLASAAIQRGISLLLSGGLAGGGFLGAGGGLIGSIFGRRASGGTTTKGLPHLVGERGPEVFVPNVTGTIAPIAAGSSSITVNLAPRLVPIIGYDGLAVRLEQSTANIARRGGV